MLPFSPLFLVKKITSLLLSANEVILLLKYKCERTVVEQTYFHVCTKTTSFNILSLAAAVCHKVFI